MSDKTTVVQMGLGGLMEESCREKDWLFHFAKGGKWQNQSKFYPHKKYLTYGS